MDRGAWRVTVYGVKQSQTGLSTPMHEGPHTEPGEDSGLRFLASQRPFSLSHHQPRFVDQSL